MKRPSVCAALPLFFLVIVVAGCPSEPTAGRGVTSAVAAPVTPPAASSAAPSREPRGVPTLKAGTSDEFPVVAGSSCQGRGQAVSPSEAKLEREPGTSRWLTHAHWGCGCPTGPVFTMVFVPKTSPLEVRLCLDQLKDTCEVGCLQAIAWDLDAPMREAGARDVRLVR